MADTDQLSPKEAVKRREAALSKMLATPPKPFTKKKPSPAKRKAKKG